MKHTSKYWCTLFCLLKQSHFCLNVSHTLALQTKLAEVIITTSCKWTKNATGLKRDFCCCHSWFLEAPTHLMLWWYSDVTHTWQECVNSKKPKWSASHTDTHRAAECVHAGTDQQKVWNNSLTPLMCDLSFMRRFESKLFSSHPFLQHLGLSHVLKDI